MITFWIFKILVGGISGIASIGAFYYGIKFWVREKFSVESLFLILMGIAAMTLVCFIFGCEPVFM